MTHFADVFAKKLQPRGSHMDKEVLCQGGVHMYDPHVQVCQCGEEQFPQPGRKGIQQGWMCPQCGTIYAPHVSTCEKCLEKGEVLRK